MAPGDRVAGLNRFKLIVRENLIEAQPLVMRMAREAHVLVQDHRLVRVRINNRREKLFYFSNLLDDEYTEAAGQASLRTVSYDYPEDGGTDKALVYSDSPQYRGNNYDFPEHFRRALTQMGVPRTDWEPLLRRYSDFNTAISGFGAADPADFFDLEYLGRYETIRFVLGWRDTGSSRATCVSSSTRRTASSIPPSVVTIARQCLTSVAAAPRSCNSMPFVTNSSRVRSRCSTSWPGVTACGRRSIGRSTASSSRTVSD